MSAVLAIQSNENAESILHLVQSAIDNEIKRLQFAIQQAEIKLAEYEQRYTVSSIYFINEMTAEDLSGGDDEYISWFGEYQLYQKLLAKKNALLNIDYVAR